MATSRLARVGRSVLTRRLRCIRHPGFWFLLTGDLGSAAELAGVRRLLILWSARLATEARAERSSTYPVLSANVMVAAHS